MRFMIYLCNIFMRPFAFELDIFGLKIDIGSCIYLSIFFRLFNPRVFGLYLIYIWIFNPRVFGLEFINILYLI